VVSGKGTDLEKLLRKENHFNIGRLNRWVSGTFNSKWANLYTVKLYGREQSLYLYQQYVEERCDLMNELDDPLGRVLVCWCHPQPCHGHMAKLCYNKLMKS